MTAYQRVIDRLIATGAKHEGKRWTCPAHNDPRPSLAVDQADDRVLLKCHAGCPQEKVVAALNLTMADLFNEPKRKSDRRIVETYDYLDEDRFPLFEVVRYEPKDFRQRHRGEDGRWVWKMDGVRRVPYRLPYVVNAAKRGDTVYIVEGERDVHAVEEAGAVATCNPGGAGKWRSEFAEHFTGATVVVVADRDEPGRKHARQVADSLKGVAASVEIVEPAEGKDAEDHLGAGKGLEDFVPQDAAEVPRRTKRASDIWPEAVSWLWEDRVPLGMPTVIGGFPGLGKSTILYDLAARVSRQGKDVVVATAEDHLAAVARPRLEAAGADLDRVHFVVEPITLPDDAGTLEEIVREKSAALVILDPLVAFVGDAVNTHRDHHVRRVLAPLADLAEDTGAAVLVVIHTNKDASSEPLMRLSGSIGFSGAARSVLLAADDPQDENRRILAVVKTNLAEPPSPLAYRITGVPLDGGIRTSRIDWLGEAPEVDPRELLVVRDPEERSAREEAEALLREAGVLKEPRPASEIQAAARAQGISEKTLQRARRSLHVPAWPNGFGGPWYWGPRPSPDLGTQSGHPHPVQTVQTGDTQGKQTPQDPSLDNGAGVGEPSIHSRREEVRARMEAREDRASCRVCGKPTPWEDRGQRPIHPGCGDQERLGVG